MNFFPRNAPTGPNRRRQLSDRVTARAFRRFASSLSLRPEHRIAPYLKLPPTAAKLCRAAPPPRRHASLCCAEAGRGPAGGDSTRSRIGLSIARWSAALSTRCVATARTRLCAGPAAAATAAAAAAGAPASRQSVAVAVRARSGARARARRPVPHEARPVGLHATRRAARLALRDARRAPLEGLHSRAGARV